MIFKKICQRLLEAISKPHTMPKSPVRGVFTPPSCMKVQMGCNMIQVCIKNNIDTAICSINITK